MKRLFLITAILFAGMTYGQGYTQTTDFQLHVYAGVATGSLAAQMNETLNIDMPNALAYVAGATAAGLIKESYDAIDYGKFSVEDLAATMAGGFFAWVFQEGVTAIFNVEPKYVRAFLIAGGIVGVGLTVNLKK